MACSTLMMRGVRGLVIGLYGKEKEMRYWLGLLAIGALALQPLIVSQAQAANALERAIGDAQPCRSLKAKVSSFGITVQVGVDKLDSVKIENLQVSVNGDAAQASARGTLACKTSDEARQRRVLGDRRSPSAGRPCDMQDHREFDRDRADWRSLRRCCQRTADRDFRRAAPKSREEHREDLPEVIDGFDPVLGVR